MIKNKYIIKNLAPWMIDELIAFSNLSTFEVVFLRKQDKFYDDTIANLRSNNINIYTKPYALNNLIKKIYISIVFLLSNIAKFGFSYNGVIGLKSIFWFLKLDLSKFTESSKIHTQFATQGAIVSLLIKRYYKNKPEYSFTFHAHDIYFNNLWFDLLVKECYRSFSISDYNIKYINENYRPSNKIKLARLGVFRNLLKNDSSINNKEEVLRIGLISWFVEKKGINYLLKALVELRNKGYKNIKLDLAGDGPLKDEYLNFVEKNNLKDIVNYMGTIKAEQKREFFQNLDVFVLPCIELKNDKDGIPVVLMEAIDASLPIISTDVSGVPEICFNDYNGILIEQKNTKELVSAITFMAENIDQRKLYGRNSFKLSEKYDIVLNSKNKIQDLGWN